jgi:hypothetical protein
MCLGEKGEKEREKKKVTYILKFYSRIQHYHIEVFDVANIIIIAHLSFILHIHVLLFIAYHNMTFDDND